MARTNIATQELDPDGATLVEVAADVANGNMCNIGESVLLFLRNSGVGARNVTIQTPGEAGGVAIADVVIALASGVTKVAGPFAGAVFAQKTGADVGKMYINGDHAEVKIGVLRV